MKEIVKAAFALFLAFIGVIATICLTMFFIVLGALSQ